MNGTRVRRWFLSYHSSEEALAQRLKEAMERQDAGARVFFAPAHLRAGGFWSRALADEIARADAFVLLVGEKGVGDWQVLEYDEALARRVTSPAFPLILMLLDGQEAPGLPFLRRLHWVVTPDPASEKAVARLIEGAAGSDSRPGELWRHTSPYRGLAAMEEKDSDYFFGRGRKTAEALRVLATEAGRMPVLLGNSGVGKSSLARAGVLAALKRQAWPDDADAPGPWPTRFENSRRWCFLTLKPGTDPLRALVAAFVETWQFAATDPQRLDHLIGWVERLRDGKAAVSDLMEATDRRYRELGHEPPPAFLLYVDQGEELYVRAGEAERWCFSELLAAGMSHPRLFSLVSMRADFLGELQKDEPLYRVHRKIDVPPLRKTELREVVSRPARLLSARFEPEALVNIITQRTAEDSARDVGALPLLSYTLDDMWKEMVRAGDGRLRLPAQAFELGGVLAGRADGFLAAHPEAEEVLRRILTLKLATVREGEEPTRRRAPRMEFSNGEWRLVSELADNPYRLLVTATSESGDAYAEVAHEAIFRRWQKLRDWIAAEREFLAWRTGLDAWRRDWQQTPANSRTDALLVGSRLTQASAWLEQRRDDLSEPDRNFIELSKDREFLVWRANLEATRTKWQEAPPKSRASALLAGAALAQARRWSAKRRDDLSEPDRDFIELSLRAERGRRRVVFSSKRRGTVTLSDTAIDRRVATQTQSYLAPAQQFLELADADAAGQGVFEGGPRVERLALQALGGIGRAEAFRYAGPDGNFMYVLRNARGGFDTKTVDRRDGGHRVTWVRRDADGEVVATEETPDDTFDPRTRPWYQGAEQTRKPFWTDTYLFFTAKKPGITFSIPHFDAEGKLQTVLGVDIELATLCAFLKQLDIGISGKALIIDQNGRVVAYPSDNWLPADNPDVKAPLLDELDDPVLTLAYNRLRVEGYGRKVLDFGDRRFIVSSEPMSMLTDRNWVVLIVVPETDFSGP
jgi:hypothetical protein